MNRNWKIFWSVLALVLVVRAGVRDRGVITDHLEFGRRLAAGEPLYEPFEEPDKALHPVYPPSFGLFTMGFVPLGERGARFAWATLEVLALLGVGLVFASWLGRNHPQLQPRLPWILLLAFLLCSRYVLRDTHGGGGNLINLGLLTGAAELARRRRDLGAGFCLGLSLATKPTFVLFLPLFWLLGARRLAVSGALAAVGLALTALLVQGHGDDWWRWIQGSFLYGTRGDPYSTPAYGFPPFTWMNQNLACMTGRYLGVVPAELHADLPGWFPGLELAPTTVQGIRLGVSGALLGCLFLAARRCRGDEQRGVWVGAAALAIGLLLSPISWKAHHVALLPAFALLLTRAFRGERWLWFLALLYVLTCLLGEELVGDRIKEAQQGLYLVTAGTLVTALLCLRECWRVDPRPAPC